jgi:serine/threonine protein kinase/tetratricopeptide (TPR) repeat protein
VANECPKCQFENPDETAFCGKCGTKFDAEDVVHTKTLETPTEELTTGSTFAGRYLIIEELGKGGMGRVYKVLDKETKEKIALKLIKPEIASDKKTIERFRNELTTARKIAQRNVCQMYDLNKDKDSHYITMEYVPGEDLKSLIKRVKVDIGTSIKIAKQVCEGLSEAHRLGVVHRDLKPSNIMIDKEGDAKIMDFGIARTVKGKGITGSGVMIGTPEYMSPEQVEAKEVDQRSDIYSLGIIVYEMTTGRLPFEGDTSLAVAMKHKSEIPKSPKEYNPQISDDFSKAILKCLEKDKENRYQKAEEVKSELERIEQGLPTTDRVVPQKKPLTSREITVQISPRKIFIPALIVAAIIIAAIVIWQRLPQKEMTPTLPSDKPSLAIMYFKNNTGDTNLDHWQNMLSNLLIADLTQSKHIRVLSEDKLFNILGQLNQEDAKTYSSDVLKQVAAQGEVNHILTGAYAKAGDQFRINVILQDASTLEHIDSESISGTGEQSIFSMVDELTRRIKANFQLSSEEIASDIDKAIGIVTTSSPEAYKYYIEGIQYDLKGDYQKVIEYMEKAVEIDPEFASAYLVMSWSYGNLNYYAEEKIALQKALELSDRLTDRERYNIEGQFYMLQSEKTYDKSLEAFENLMQLYPDDITGNNSLAILYGRLGDRDKAIEHFEICVRNKTEDVIIYTNLAGTYRTKGLYDKSIEVLESYINNIRDSDFIRRSLALTYRCQGKYDLALAEVDKALSFNPNSWQNITSKGGIYFYMGDFDSAEQEYRKLLEREEPLDYGWGLVSIQSLYLLQGKFKEVKEKILDGIELSEELGQIAWIMNGHSALSYAELRLGNPDQAIKELKKVWGNAIEEEYMGTQRAALRNMGLVYCEMGSIEEAENTAKRLREMTEQAPNKNLISGYYYLMGRIELEKKNYSQAIEHIEKGLPLLTATSELNLLFMDSLGLAYYRKGDLENAQKVYESASSLTTGRSSYGDIYAKSFYMLGKIYEELDWKGKAIEKYEKFLELWKEADPGLFEVDDAKSRFSSLTKE